MFLKKASFRSKRYILEVLLLFCFLSLCILFTVKSWRLFFFSGMAEHWDPKIMGEWMAWNAHNILRGHFFLPNYHANFFYPHSYTLAFSELLWPESFVYALFYFLTSNLFFSFNATMLAFWALSGITLFALLRTLEISRIVSVFGSCVYCLMPYRMPYYVEFNMVLVFILPLMVLLLVRWLKDHSYKNALWFCLGFLVSATSCLYYTIMAIIIMVFVSVAFLANDRSLWCNRKFYLSGGLIVFGTLSISLIYLYPYALLRIQGGYQRSTADYLKYFAQPMQYLDTACAAFLKWIKIPPPRFTETFLFPGTILSLLVSFFLIYKIIRYFQRNPAVPGATRYIGAMKFGLWTVFWSIILLHAYLGPVSWLTSIDPYIYHLSLSLIFLSIGALFFVDDSQKTTPILLAGLSAAAILCFFISFGPFISVGTDGHRQVLARGPFLDVASWNPLFSAVRSLTRFSIVILTYFIIAGCYVLDLIVRRNKKIVWLLPVLFVMLVYEARVIVQYKFENSTPVINDQVIKKAQNLPEPYVLLQLPIAVRNIEAKVVMTTIGRFPLLINGWSGFEPNAYKQLYSWEARKWEVKNIFPWVQQIWPPAYLLIDRGAIITLEKSWKKPFPWEEIEQSWDLIDKDKGYALYRQKQDIFTSNQIIRYIRTDLLKSHSLLSFKAHIIPQGDVQSSAVSVFINHKPVKEKIPLSETWEEITMQLPEDAMGRIEGEEIDIELASLTPTPPHWEVKDIDFKEIRR
jgi:hypothetical protein